VAALESVAAIAQRFAANGARVCVLDSDEIQAKHVAKEIAAEGGGCSVQMRCIVE
jgi:NAD(P)-dependent dehydrogenase (short-subunit alcohol dehydrogenase family)